jgi:hypothetical protein
MELMLPTSKSATGSLRFEQGDLADRRYSVEIRICPSPVCQCERVRLRCFPAPQSPVPVCLEMDLEQCKIANFKELSSDPESITLAKAVAKEITKADWINLRSFYLGVKQYLTEQIDPDQIDADFPPDVLAGDAGMVGYKNTVSLPPSHVTTLPNPGLAPSESAPNSQTKFLLPR